MLNERQVDPIEPSLVCDIFVMDRESLGGLVPSNPLEDNLRIKMPVLTVSQTRVEIERVLAKQRHHKIQESNLRNAVQKNSRRKVSVDVLNQALAQLVKVGRIEIVDGMISRKR